MDDRERTKAQLMSELAAMRRRVAELEASERTVGPMGGELQESEERYRALFERTLYCVYIHDFEGRFLDANEAALKLLGYRNDEIRSLTFSSLMDEAQLPTAFETIRQIRETGSQKKVTEYKLRKKNGDHVWVETDASLIYRYGKPYGIQGIARDITERKQTERALVENEEKYRDVVERANDGIVLIQDGVLRYANRRTAEMTGYAVEELIGTPFTTYIHPDELSVVAERYERRIGGKKVVPIYESAVRHKDGRRIDVEFNAGLISYEGKPADLVIMRDICERKRAERQIQASLREKEILLKEIHHRVKNNLQVISGLLLLQSRELKDRQAIEMLAECQNRIKSMAMVHEELYRSQDLSQIRFGEYIQTLAADLVRSYKVDPHIVALKTDIEDILLGVDVAIPCGLILNELLANSLKHAFPCGRRGEIRVEFRRGQDSELMLTVSDNGIGFPQDVDFRKTSTLGLQLVNTLTDQLRGRVELDARRGTAFKIVFKSTIS